MANTPSFTLGMTGASAPLAERETNSKPTGRRMSPQPFRHVQKSRRTIGTKAFASAPPSSIAAMTAIASGPGWVDSSDRCFRALKTSAEILLRRTEHNESLWTKGEDRLLVGSIRKTTIEAANSPSATAAGGISKVERVLPNLRRGSIERSRPMADAKLYTRQSRKPI
ncbi:hypothetical protein BDV96DRAFT_606164 [Lophiotrema nucula]|uniref:Uncharacterized protein n=1 Tax=Lophiotrema nucula TaxID=690887 RepID=A0A6A5YP27_9PLEO|nr:hypothetical protein BDV96DRAFT_606164 [Lophiotrema nucula]